MNALLMASRLWQPIVEAPLWVVLLVLKQANAEGVRGDFLVVGPADTTNGRRHGGRRKVSRCIVFHGGLGGTQCGSG